ncbi:serine protease [Collimonas sp.]|jgi:S1-C subfamily serine protease|uniref:S1 family peptidase n=1 Tax=Collimonas sp. TaxID=1963772 RepID=UPI002C0A875F|nr:serine protease [Collimonas sp.]HWW08547.1 serine protease [Collimonas sp.]
MTTVADLVEKIRSGVIHIEYSSHGKLVGSGTGFMCRDHLITNNHVYQIALQSIVTLVKLAWQPDADVASRQEVQMRIVEFKRQFIGGSDVNNYDYAILNVPQLVARGLYQFEPADHMAKRISDPIVILGFPFDHQNLVCHSGTISSFYRNNGVDIIQLDASVNPSNSGGPLVDPETGAVVGIVTRKGTGLTCVFDELEAALRQNIQYLEATRARTEGAMVWNMHPVAPALASQKQIFHLVQEIRRSANVGIGYAFSIQHLLRDLPGAE